MKQHVLLPPGQVMQSGILQSHIPEGHLQTIRQQDTRATCEHEYQKEHRAHGETSPRAKLTQPGTLPTLQDARRRGDWVLGPLIQENNWKALFLITAVPVPSTASASGMHYFCPSNEADKGSRPASSPTDLQHNQRQ